MWESIKKFFGFGKSEAVVEAPVVEVKVAAPKKAKAAPKAEKATEKVAAPKKAKKTDSQE